MSDAGQLSSGYEALPFSASADYTPDAPSRGVYIATAGNLVCKLQQSAANRTIVGLLAGTVYPFRVAQIIGSGTTATGHLLY